jgi:uncharacterized membrane protein
MKTHRFLRWTFVVVVMSIPWIYLATIWRTLPQTIPVHFNAFGAPDKYGQKNEIFFAPITFTVISLLVYLLLTNIYKIDPKRYALKQGGTFTKIAVAVVVFLSCLCLLLLTWTVRQSTIGLSLFLAMMGLLFAYIGNVMHSIKPNYFAGFRLPWTLESEENWRATHLLVSKLWFAGGILIAILAFLIKPFIMFFVMFGIVLVMVVIPIVYSYKYFIREKSNRRL